ncbi:hypothetical protein [Thiothrix eikelboomii]|uniref:hypothetical protein n=1 Tax=Thiothrix eikelboomii TaxID=92487 RepID=UPI003BAFB459
MTIIRSIASEGAYDTLFIQGKNRNIDLGLRVHLEADQQLHIQQLVIENTFLPLVKSGDGLLSIGRLQIKDFGGDGINLWGNGLSIHQLIVRNSTPTRPYHTLRVTALTETQILAALQASKQQVYDWRLLQWLETQENGQTVFYSPGYHSDIALQAYRPKPKTVTSRYFLPTDQTSEPSSEFMPLHLPVEQLETLALNFAPPPLDLVTGSQARSLTMISPINRLLDQVAETPYSLELDTKNRIRAIDLHVPLANPQLKAPIPNAPEDLAGIAEVTIRELDIQTNDANSQLFMLSEQQRYRNFKIGTDKIVINCRYPWWFVANTLEDSVIGNANKVQINQGRSSLAKVRIGDGQDNSKYCIKPSSCSTGEVSLVGLGKTGHVVPTTVRIL